MNKAYNRINWVNYPNTDTALNALNLNLMDSGLNEIDNRVVSLDLTKANQSDMYNAVRSIVLNPNTGVITITYFNGTTTQIDTGLEKIATNMSYDSDPTSEHYQQLILTLTDGTIQYVDLSALITQYEFRDTATIRAIISNGTVSFDIIDGSITSEKLQPNYLAAVTTQANIASQAATNASASESNSEAWAVGERQGVPVSADDPTFQNYSKFYADQSASILGTVRQYANLTVFSINFVTGELEFTEGAYTFYIDATTGNLMWDVA